MLFQAMIDDYVPILVDGRLMVLDKSCNVNHKEIFDAVTKGLPVRTELMIR